ncbi:TetR/AcrR family transcriptional regulator [Streptomyces boluensis]|uniref:TetR family transcriptional regulator n=2 Tax=Streptomyces boluensis TaxID=1775135 RepID=A0A964US69_9ACTN|nr:TetR family transcriptional regulator [Streptomyces boluensis]NBE53465.1 TetR family transcriptional regulator [Streptomyces boluensis]
MKAARTPDAPRTSNSPGLRERKKLKTRAAIRRATFALITEQGYEATTVEQIAEAAEVSPSTVIRYFPAKEDIVLGDRHDPVAEAALRARPADEPVLDSLRHVVKARLRAALDDPAEREELLLRARLIREVPAVRARMLASLTDTARLLAPTVADRTGRDPDDLKVRVFTTAVIGSLLETTLYWTEHGTGHGTEHGHGRPDALLALVDEALDVFAGGL